MFGLLYWRIYTGECIEIFRENDVRENRNNIWVKTWKFLSIHIEIFLQKNIGKSGKTWKKTVASVYCQKFFKYCRAS